ncbi:TetR/AcrR family transcriptional regulator [Aneurinibacillus migulanus]|uniref:TetR/AcrR family transcriptional regulator n=1 Tax=Aneurinibacillus migulanus TaxID=47500 RepID=UPI0006989196|nr:TetR/AcrR family transcriptional regulator [Aneurinibacillus migulanus]CEH29439.1 Transcriptional regulator, TetR family [Aneurinibacillus migulanus]
MNRKEKKRVTRERIISTAIRLFSQKGYESTTVSLIAQEAGVSKGTFFNYFKTKEDVLHEYENDALLLEFEMVTKQPGPMTPRIMAGIVSLLTRMNYTRALCRSFFQAAMIKPHYLEENKERMRGIRGMLTPLFAIGQERGEYSKKMPAEMLADAMIRTYQGLLINWAMGGGDDNLIVQAMVTFELFFSGITLTSS